METKKCKACGDEKSLNDYHYSKGVYKSYCKVCANKRSVEYKRKKADEWNKYQREYYKMNKEKHAGNHTKKNEVAPCGVYEITCLITGDTYVGSSKNIRSRIYKHKRNVGWSKQKDLAKLIKAYGWNDETFSWKVLEYTTPEQRFERERFYKAELKPTLNRTK